METPPSHSSERITVHYHRDPRQETHEFQSIIREDCHVLSIPLCRGRVTLTSDDKQLHDGSVFPGMMRLASPGENVRGVVYGPSESVALRIPGARLRATVQATNPSHLPGEVCFVNALVQPQFEVERLGRLLMHAEKFDAVHSQLFVDGVADALLACLLYHHRVDRQEHVAKKGLEPGELRRVVDFAEAHLEGTLSLKAWAAVLEMSTPEFTRRFRAATGSSPYAWFMQRRIDRSKELLRCRQIPLCDVALSVGFSSQSHFTEAFRRREGTSPARWRESHGA